MMTKMTRPPPEAAFSWTVPKYMVPCLSPKRLSEPALHFRIERPPTIRDILPDGWPTDRQGGCTVLACEEGSVDGEERGNYVSQKQQVPYEATQFKGV